MAKYLKIEIPSACQQDWNNMQAQADGKFCSSCQKTVIDFTGMTDEQLIAFFKHSPANVCGRFYDDQLDNLMPLPVKKIPWLKYFFQVSIPAMLWGSSALAQEAGKHSPAFSIAEKKPAPTWRGGYWISGTITGFENNPLAGASVMIPGTGRGVAADSSGVFNIMLFENEDCLQFSMVGYEEKLLTVTDSISNIQLNLLTSGNVVLPTAIYRSKRRTSRSGGAIAVLINELRSNPAAVKQTVYQANLFPNPAKRNSNLMIRWKNSVSNDQHISIYNSAGIKLLQQTISINQPTTQGQVNLALHAAGYYIIHITDSHSHKRQVSTLIVE